METKPLSSEKIAQIKDLLKEMDINGANQSLIQDNKLIFTKDEKIYRCSMPSQIEQTEAEARQNALKVKLIQSDDTITRKRLIKVLKEKQDIDIVQLEKDKEAILKELQDTQLDLAMTLSEDEKKVQELSQKVLKIEEKFMELTIEIITFLSPCIEEQVKASYYKYLAYTCTEKQIEKDKFEKVWNEYSDFENDDTGLSHHALGAIESLLLNIKE